MWGKTITYAIDLDTGLVVSRVGSQYAWPILDFEGMKPENNFETIYNLEKIPIFQANGTSLRHTRKIPLEQKNLHREFWGMKKVKPSPKYCPLCGEYWKKDKCKKEVKNV
jgi:hypothetical protein